MEDLLILKNKKVKKLVHINLIVSYLVSVIGIGFIWIFKNHFISFYLLDIGIIVFRTGLLIGVFAIIYGLFFEKYLNC